MAVGSESAATTRRREPGWRVPVWLTACGAQAVAWLAISLAPGAFVPYEASLRWLAHAAVAAALGHACGLPWWWAVINGVFVIALWAASEVSIDPGWYLAGFLALAAVYGAIHRTRVPLYLSGRQACVSLADLLPRDRTFRFLDAGCGVGTVLAYLAPRFPNGRLEGVELALVPWVFAWLRGTFSARFRCRRADLWQQDLSRYDIVYAFLSPVTMTALWQKAQREMRPGSLLVSNSFAVEGVAPDAVIPLPVKGRSLYVWRC